MAAVHAFCPSCGGNVVCESFLEGNRRKVVCRNCHYVVETKTVAGIGAGALPDPPQTMTPAGPVSRSLGTVLAAEDVAPIRTAIQSMLVSKGVAKNVVATADGFEALVAFHKAAKAGAKLDLLVLDINMPIMDGINAAVCIRAAEKASGSPPHPILFFTANVIDESFKRALEYLQPARYLNKGSGTTGEEFGERLVAVIKNLLGI